jgi:hypothetical protein
VRTQYIEQWDGGFAGRQSAGQKESDLKGNEAWAFHGSVSAPSEDGGMVCRMRRTQQDALPKQLSRKQENGSNR